MINWQGVSSVPGLSAAGLREHDEADERIISSFFIVHGARRSGVGRAAVKHVTGLHPGPWSVAFQDSNSAASRFWPTVATEADDHWTLEYLEVPGRPDLPADAWVHFGVR